MKTLDEAMDEVTEYQNRPVFSNRLEDTNARNQEIIAEAGENKKVAGLVLIHEQIAKDSVQGALFSAFVNGLIVGMAMEKQPLPDDAAFAGVRVDAEFVEPTSCPRCETLPCQCGLIVGMAMENFRSAHAVNPQPTEIAETSANTKPMNRSENPLLPWFGHNPPDFGIPEGYEPEQPNRSVNPNAEQVPSSNQIAGQLDAIENLYRIWTNSGPRWIRRLILKLASKPIRMFRQQLHTVITAYSKAVNQKTAANLQTGEQGQIHKVVGDIRELRAFLLTHFPDETQAAESVNKPLFTVCKEIMLRLKDGK